MVEKAILDGDQSRKQIANAQFPVCPGCQNWHTGKDTCDAFPLGIPDAIYSQGNSHEKEFPGDNGIQFEAIE